MKKKRLKVSLDTKPAMASSFDMFLVEKKSSTSYFSRKKSHLPPNIFEKIDRPPNFFFF